MVVVVIFVFVVIVALFFFVCLSVVFFLGARDGIVDTDVASSTVLSSSETSGAVLSSVTFRLDGMAINVGTVDLGVVVVRLSKGFCRCCC